MILEIISVCLLISSGMVLVYKLCSDLFHSFDTGTGGGIKAYAK